MAWNSSSSGRRLLDCEDRKCVGASWALVSAIFTVGSLLALASPIAATPDLKGIDPKDLQYYESSIIWCRDKSKSFPRERLNDNFCDCRDGTDEPGTSACPESKFYCSNIGHRPETLFSSRVNDGICDCCDGSDEYDGKIKCSNTCWEAGKKSREKLEKKLATFKEGLKLRTKDVDYARHKRKEQQEELSTLKKDEKNLKDVVKKLKVHLDAIEKAEKEEELKRAKAEQERQAKQNASIGNTNASVTETPTEVRPEDFEVEISDVQNSEDSQVEEKEAGSHEEGLETVVQSEGESENLESLSKEELGKLVASRWTGEKVEHEGRFGENSDNSHHVMEETDEAVDDSSNNLHETGEEFENNENADWVNEDRENEDNEEEEEEEEEEDNYEKTYVPSEHTDSLSPPSSPWWKRVLLAPQTLLKLIGVTNLQFDKSEVERIRREFSEANSKLTSLQRKISDLELKLKQDFGKDGEFFSFYDQCFEMKLNKYLYKICPYKQASQNENHATSRLGTWDGFKDDYKVMVFSNGDKCWNGPDRSLKVRLRCGLKNEVLSVEEPSRCEYVAELTTPASCLESKLLALQQQQRNAESQLHEEL
ncbi:hypothetical protein O6H91_21G065900 [Diphasiastrum complanatum]|uniref:Uncharacterized protein n=1 Tax=Diphasiastrum complanatum TaxID=34168 RepID=A0ACC2ALB8_DIPCM|nr:hypothetical protein O6H91_21G065900 [Diphasiastrum complanatum]